MQLLEELKGLLSDILLLGDRGRQLDATSPLLGSLPELDSMAVISVVTALEERFGITIDDDDITGDTFATLGSLAAFVEAKLAQ